MKPFKATYTPQKWNEVGEFDGYDENKAERVVVVQIMGYDWKSIPDVVFAHADGKLDIAALPCFSEAIFGSLYEWTDR